MSEKKATKLTEDDVKTFVYDKEPKVNAKGDAVFLRDVRWDTEIKGFGVRVFPTGRKSYIYKYRLANNETKIITIGDTKKLALKQARERAKKLAVEVIDGGDPRKDRQEERNSKALETVAELCEHFLQNHTIANGHSKKRIEVVQQRNRDYIIPALGRLKIQDVTTSDIKKLHHQIGTVQKHPDLASSVKQQLARMFKCAIEWGLVKETFQNPTSGVKDSHKGRQRELYVFPEHMSILADAIEQEGNASAKLAIWMFILTGKRKMEILSARWDQLDQSARTLYIPKTKNGEQEQLPLSDEAWAIIERAKAFRKENHPYIFPGLMPDSHIVNIHKPWSRIRDAAIKNGASSLKRETLESDGTKRIEYVVIHGLRHTAAVWLVNHADIDTALVGKILNHKSSIATKRYAKFKIGTKEKALQNLGSMVTTATKTPAGKVVDFTVR